MEVSITGVYGHGDASKEHVMLSVDSDCDLGGYILADTTYVEPNRVSNELRHMFWFPTKRVVAGDTVVLRTCAGTQTEEKRELGSTRHRFYWGLEVAVWNDTGDVAILFEIAEWAFRIAK
ncbi:hypothetical protein [Polymorphobacter megasporae]|uniref:hypothetical protein n=1 Tax=Glacieibacterium megasporae TaxID=2835787 RepID=UPI001C1E54F5|nr:hypothetical protein [Polymorphobacter megasporae]UAJ10649.1 hypothetical protein KTC28_02520 [Polymorphobacter megasporae]